MALIELNKISFKYDDEYALKDISLSINEGECVGLSGDNGSGKTTLIKIINGVIFPVSGEYIFDGKTVDEKSMKKEAFSKNLHQKLGFVFQNPDTQLFCNSVREEIEFGPRQMGLSEAEIKKRAEDVMELLNISHIEERAPYHLSGGEKKKTAIASILSMNPDVLILDEPLTGLDKKSQQVLMDFLFSWKKAGKTLIIATHDENLMKKIADRVISIGDNHELVTE